MLYVLFLKLRGPTLTKILRNAIFHNGPEKGALLKEFILQTCTLPVDRTSAPTSEPPAWVVCVCLLRIRV